jgi:tetratricopeptide (TPR) repeat protein
VLEWLQSAADHGAPLTDHGEGRFSLPEDTTRALRATMLPSLLSAWHERIASALVSQGQPPGTAPASVSTATVAPPRKAATKEAARSTADALPGESETREGATASAPPAPVPGTDDPEAPRAGRRSAEYAASFAPSPATQAPGPEPGPGGETDQSPEERFAGPVRRPGLAGETVTKPVSMRELADAASHLERAGRMSEAAGAYLRAAEQSLAEGVLRSSAALIDAARRLLPRVGVVADRARLNARVKLATARLQWLDSGQHGGDTLAHALRSVQAAGADVGDLATPDLLADIAALQAGIAYDLGDTAAVQAALEALVAASRALLAAGEPLRAARLLNDQAALNLRFGDPVQAVRLLEESRERFGQLAAASPGDLVVLEEIAHTDHLLAKMPPHAGLRPGREKRAIEMALDSAGRAERAFTRLRRPRETARVWETAARLHLASGDSRAAAQHLDRAVRQQQSLGDATGLARTAAAYTELLLAMGRAGDALAYLADSVALNYRKGSPIGLRFNAESVQALRQAVERGAPDLRPRVDELEAQLAEANRRLREASPSARGTLIRFNRPRRRQPRGQAAHRDAGTSGQWFRRRVQIVRGAPREQARKPR